MLYIGYPITKATAFKLFNQPLTVDIEAYIRSKQLRLYDIDKGLCILGLAVKSLTNYAPHYVSVDDTIITILNYKKKVISRLSAAHADLSDFELEVMESIPIHVQNPPPMAMTFDDYGAYYSDSEPDTLPHKPCPNN
jgi:capsule polysaccharide export protein KpsC/LpsZ